MEPNHDLLPELRRRRFMTAERLRDSLRNLNAAQRHHAELESIMAELDQQIAKHDFYRPPPRPYP